MNIWKIASIILMIHYDLQKIIEISKRNPYKIIKILNYITYKQIPTNFYDFELRQYQKTNWMGESFLLNPEALLEVEPMYPINKVMQYIALASKRAIGEFILYRELRLNRVISITPIDKLKDNPLLTITKDFIEFNLEKYDGKVW